MDGGRACARARLTPVTRARAARQRANRCGSAAWRGLRGLRCGSASAAGRRRRRAVNQREDGGEAEAGWQEASQSPGRLGVNELIGVWGGGVRSVILAPDMGLIHGSPDPSGSKILDALELKELVRVTFDWTGTQRL